MMVNSISQTSNVQVNNSNESLAQQLADLIKEYRAHMNDQNPTQELAIMQKLSAFIATNKAAIENLCFDNGHGANSPDWTQHYEAFIASAQKTYQNALEFHRAHPNEPLPNGVTIFFNDMATQIHFLMTNK